MKNENRCLIIGASGQAGYFCREVFSNAGWKVVGTYHSKPFDNGIFYELENIEGISKLLDEYNPDVVIMAAAESNVDACEKDPEHAYRTNTLAPGEWAKHTGKRNIYFIHISTDYVFGGENKLPDEEHPPAPINKYGVSKLEGERLVLENNPLSLVARTCVVYSYLPEGKNFFMQLYNSLGNDKKGYPAFTDQFATPTYCPDLAKALFLAANKKIIKIIHVAGPQYLSRFEFATLAAKTFHWDNNLIKPSLTVDVSLPAKRPRLAGLGTDRLRTLLGDNLMKPPGKAFQDILLRLR